MIRSVVIATFVASLAVPALAEDRDPLAPLDGGSSTCASCVRSLSPLKPDAFGSVALKAGVTMYDARFRRVASRDSDAPEVMAVARHLRGLPPQAQLARVHQMVGTQVSFAPDHETLKVSDLWLNAGETLRAGRGDDEDIAIAKMQALKAAGFPARDLYLSIGRMRDVGAHVMLLARVGNGFMALDHRRSSPVNADLKSVEFKPVVTVGSGGSWVHGYRTARR